MNAFALDVPARLGKVTASRTADIVRKTKTGYSTTRANYQADLIIERLTGVQAESYKSAAMQWGTDHEQDARENYEFLRNVTVEPAGFVPHPTIAMAGASPDGYVGSDGLLETKCPLTSTHLETLLGKKVDRDYVIQCNWQMACSGRKFCDWVSYDPRLPPALQIHIERINRDDALIAELEREVIAFLSELDAKMAELQKRFGVTEKAAA
jgi:predicted phage-related endonuclease